MRTIREWVEFLGIEENAVFAVVSDKFHYKYAPTYFTKEKFLRYAEPWLDAPVLLVYHHNIVNHHLMIIPSDYTENEENFVKEG